MDASPVRSHQGPDNIGAPRIESAKARTRPSPVGSPEPIDGTLPPRPVFFLTVVFVLGIAATRFLPHEKLESFVILTAFVFLITHVAFTLVSHPNSRLFVFPLTLFFWLGFMAGSASAPHLPSHPRLDLFLNGKQTLFIAKVTHPPDYTPDKVRLPLFLQSAIIEGKEFPIGVSILAALNRPRVEPGDLCSGDWVLARLALKRFRNFANPGGFDYVRYQAEQGFYARAFIPDPRMVIKLTGMSPALFPAPLDPLRRTMDRFRQKALVWLESNLSPAAAAFYGGLLLGYQRLISDAWFEHLARSGVTHLLSIGGLHLGLVSFFTFWLVRGLVRWLRPSLLQRTTDQHIALWPALMSAAMYAGVAGFTSPPIWRSLIMLALCLIAAHWYRNPDSLSVLALSALSILVMDPNALWQISFQLTFACMLAIFTVYPRLQRFHLSRFHPGFEQGRWAARLARPFEEAFWISLAVSLMVLPLTVYYFYGVSLAGFFANIVLVPFVGFLVLPPGLASIALFAIHEKIGYPLLKVGGWFLEFAQWLIVWFSNLSWSYFWVGKPSLFTLFLCYALLAVLLSRLPLRKRGLAASIIILAAVLITTIEAGWTHEKGRRELKVNVIDVGQGASTLVRFPTGETMLVDGGGFPDDAFDMGRAVVAPFLWHSGIRRLDHVVLSHDHPDHRNGLRFILSHFDVGCFWEAGIGEAGGNSDELAAIARRRGIPIRRIPEHIDGFSGDSYTVRFLHPSAPYLLNEWNGRDLNNISLVLQIDHGKTHFILPGDLDQSAERFVFQSHDITGPVLLVAAHHGSGRSNSPFLLDRLKPQGMVFSCGYENLFGFPSADVLEECRKRRIPYYRTDLDGAIEATSDGTCWNIQRATK